MCKVCYEKAGSPYQPSSQVDDAVVMIHDLYKFAAAGGGMHIVVDDNNLDDEFITWCLDNINKYGSIVPVERAIEISVGLNLLSITEDERWTALAIAHGWRD